MATGLISGDRGQLFLAAHAGAQWLGLHDRDTSWLPAERQNDLAHGGDSQGDPAAPATSSQGSCRARSQCCQHEPHGECAPPFDPVEPQASARARLMANGTASVAICILGP